MSRLLNRPRFVPLLLADDFQSVPPNPPGDGDGDSDIPTGVDLCAVEFSDGVEGGGDTFDCYNLFQSENDAECSGVPPENLYPTWNSGTLFTGAWIHADSDLNNPRGDTFECYAPESDVQTTDFKAGIVFNGSWIYGEDSTVAGYDDFESYADDTYATDTLSGGSGWTGNWISE